MHNQIIFTLESGITIPSKYKNSNWFQNIKEHYHRVHPDYNNDDVVETDYFEELEDGSIIVPRFTNLMKFLGNLKYKIIDKRCNGSVIDIKCNIIPRNNIQKSAIKTFTSSDNGLFVLDPGEGKTVIAIAGICKLKRKTLILTHKNSLEKQWQDRFLQFTNLKKEQVCIATSKNYKESFWQPISIITNQTFISLINRDPNFLGILKNANFGICVSDECHTSVGAPTFSRCSIHIPTRRFYGLSATPNRMFDADIIKDHVGKEITFGKSKDVMTGKVYVVCIDYDILPNHYSYLYWKGKFQRSRYLNFLSRSRNLNNFVIKITNKIIDLNRNLIIVSERLGHLKQLQEIIKNKTLSVGMFVAGSNQSQLQKRVTLSTPGKIRDGIDAPWKDTLIMTSPISNIKQMVGRIARISPNKQQPVVFDLVDSTCRQISNTLSKRLRFYKSNNWEIEFAIIIRNKTIKSDETQFKHFLKTRCLDEKWRSNKK